MWTALGWRGGDTGKGGTAGKGSRPSERVRVPQPLIKSRLPSGRGATEQPNVTSDGEATLSPFFWFLVVLTGIGTGLMGDLMMVILFNVQHLAYDYSIGAFFHLGSFETAVERAPAIRRVADLMVAGVFGGVAWYLLRRFTKGEKSEMDDVVWHGGRLSFRRSFGTGIISEIVIGLGASIGRENAPKLMGGVMGSLLADRFRLTPAQRRLLVACGGGAGLAAVYNVPLGGALFTAEILLGTVTLPVMLPALACSMAATATAYLYLPNHPTYLDIPQYRFTWPLLVWSLLIGPVIGLVAVAYIRLIGWVSHHAVSGRAMIPAMFAAFTALGLIGIAYPQLFGNGKDMAHDAFIGAGGFSLLLALFALKPIVTSMCLGSGASGGLFTPTMSTGAVLGGGLGILWSMAWPGSPSGAYAMVGAAAMLGAGMQAPLSGLVLILELTYSGFRLVIPMIIATVIATMVARYLDGYSIYSARLRARPAGDAAGADRAGPPGAAPAATGR
jgi:CIC family chloride channel protein